MSLNITKTGQIKGIVVEPFLTLPDGSKWQLLLFHYVDKGNHLFTQNNATYNNEWGLFSRLKWINDFTYNNLYEFYVIQDGTIHRFTQTSQPTATAPAGLTVITGNPVQGIAKANQPNSYMGYSSWWGALGCWTQYTTGGVTDLTVYARIETPHVFFENGIENGGNIYEY